jgi:hypothetical protein
MTTDKELKEIYNFYKDCSDGFVTKDGYAAVPCQKGYMVVYYGEHLKQCRTQSSAMNFIKKHRTKPKSGTIFVK